MRFLIDAQLPPALARWLASKGHEAEHVAARMTPTQIAKAQKLAREWQPK